MPQPIEDLDDDLDDIKYLLDTQHQRVGLLGDGGTRSNWQVIDTQFVGSSSNSEWVEADSSHLPPSLGGDLSSDEKSTLIQHIMKCTEPCRAPPQTDDAAPSSYTFTFSNDEPWVSVHGDPPIFMCDAFLSAPECEELIVAGRPLLSASATMSDDPSLVNVGAGGAVRSSSSAILPAETSPACAALLDKICTLCAKPVECMERVQITQYTAGEEYSVHHDSPALSCDEQCLAFMAQGGQRVCTVLVYLNDVDRGGSTAFPTLGYECTPRQGRCLLFCPGFADGRRDERLLHAACPAADEKWVAQVWVRAHADPLQAVFQSPRWPLGCSSYSDLLKLALT